MDFGNAQTTGQVLVGNIRSKISQPASSEYLPMPRMNVITEEVSYSTIREEDSGPSCSLAEALREAGPVHQLHAGTNRLRHPLAHVQRREDILPGGLSQP